MIPINDLEDDYEKGFEIEEQPSKTYKMRILEQTINGYSDSLEAIKQAIFKMLNTERFQCDIYSWNYGAEFEDLFGEPVTYVCSELPHRITEALLEDERISAVDGFEFDINKKRVVKVTFTAHTEFGDVQSESEVNY